MQTQPTRPVTSILIEAGVVTDEQIQAGLVRQRVTGRRIGETLVEIGAATEEDIGWALARQFGIPFVDVVPEAVDHDLVRSFPEALLRRLWAVPLVRSSDGVSIALTDPTDAEAIAGLAEVAGGPLVLSLATRRAIESVLDEVWPGHGEYVAGRVAIGDRSGTSLLQFHVSQALAAGASDIHFVPRDGKLIVEHRIGARLVTAATLGFNALYGLLARIESLGGPGIDGSGDHAAGRVVCPLGDRDLPLEVSLLNGEHGIALTLALGAALAEPAPLEALGLEPLDLARLRACLEAAAGVILVAGPPRSSRSVTLAALLAAVPRDGRRVLAIERPGGSALPAALRIALEPRRAAEIWEQIVIGQNPDTVALDGVLDGESVSGALSSAAGSRLVLATTDWDDSFALLEFLGTHRLRAALSRRLLVLLQQRSVRLEAGLRSSGPEPEHAAARHPTRATLIEALFVTDALRPALREGAGAERLRALAAADGYRGLAERAAGLVEAGALSAAEAARVVV